jgi:putative sigma-54 modulation protein
MNIRYTARQAVLTPEIKAACEKRFGQLEKLIGVGRIIDANVILSVEKSRNKAEIHIVAKGANLVVEEETLDMMTSIGQAFENLEKKVRKDRAKWRERKRRGGRERKEMAPLEPAEPSETVRRIVSSRNYSLKPMSLEEAVVQLEADGSEVFLFRRENSEKWSVVFRRGDGHIGLVEPE